MSGLIIDPSVILAWYFDDEESTAVDATMARTDTEIVLVPSHWFAEIANGMLVGERRKRSTAVQSTYTIDLLSDFRIDVDDEGGRTALNTLLPLARQYRLTVYDTAYLELAMRRNLPLATLDRDLAAASRAAGVSVIDL